MLITVVGDVFGEGGGAGLFVKLQQGDIVRVFHCGGVCKADIVRMFVKLQQGDIVRVFHCGGVCKADIVRMFVRLQQGDIERVFVRLIL